jgi:hypothetical protein
MEVLLDGGEVFRRKSPSVAVMEMTSGIFARFFFLWSLLSSSLDYPTTSIRLTTYWSNLRPSNMTTIFFPGGHENYWGIVTSFLVFILDTSSRRPGILSVGFRQPLYMASWPSFCPFASLAWQEYGALILSTLK